MILENTKLNYIFNKFNDYVRNRIINYSNDIV